MIPTEENVSANVICRFDGNQNDFKNTNFNIEIGFRKRGIYHNKPYSTVYISVHFYDKNDFIIYSDSRVYDTFLEYTDDNTIDNFLYDKNIMQYIKDELVFLCGIEDEKLLNSIQDKLREELKNS